MVEYFAAIVELRKGCLKVKSITLVTVNFKLMIGTTNRKRQNSRIHLMIPMGIIQVSQICDNNILRHVFMFHVFVCLSLYSITGFPSN